MPLLAPPPPWQGMPGIRHWSPTSISKEKEKSFHPPNGGAVAPILRTGLHLVLLADPGARGRNRGASRRLTFNRKLLVFVFYPVLYPGCLRSSLRASPRRGVVYIINSGHFSPHCDIAITHDVRDRPRDGNKSGCRDPRVCRHLSVCHEHWLSQRGDIAMSRVQKLDQGGRY